jgi:hypothetical protein
VAAIGRSERGQTTIEWVGLVALVGVLLAAIIAATGGRVPGASLAHAIASKLVCALELDDTCATEPDLVAAYGVETAELVREHAPWVFYEKGMTALPVDYRECRESECSVGTSLGEATRTDAGLAVTAFVHVIDCRDPSGAAADADCSGAREGHLYIQYWFYYVDSATLEGSLAKHEIRELSRRLGRSTFHPDDWESYQVRIGPGGGDARAGSHHGYNYEGGPRNWPSDAGLAGVNEAFEDAGLRREGGWGPETGMTWVSGGSHAGHVSDNPDARLVQGDYRRWTPPGGLALAPLEPIAAEEGDVEFAIVAPWLKEVWSDGEFDSG